tara:strand:+ start:1134 stop:1808 length:675 start_codon:yes stop_codon:yes gene_type:complete
MSLIQPDLLNLKPGDDCRDVFKIIYNNRYTWPLNFNGYKGKIIYTNFNKSLTGSFNVSADIKSEVNDITDENIKKAILSQLWEVTIHRVNRDFDEVHNGNTFTIGDSNEYGCEVIVGGKSSGDKYRIKDGYVSMVYRHIHGKIVNIYTQNIIDTGNGYLSKEYTSEYIDSNSESVLRVKNHYQDEFKPLFENGPWVLSRRTIKRKLEETEELESFECTDLIRIS